MDSWCLGVLGVPVLTRMSAGPDDERELRFRYRDTWLLLASLALDPKTCHRDALVLRLGLDEGLAGRDKLRYRLNDLRNGAVRRGKESPSFCGLGKESLITLGENVWLREGWVKTDYQEVLRLCQEAEWQPSPEGRVVCLKRAAGQLRGGFLAGCNLPVGGDGWLEQLRYEVDRLSAEVWFLLAEALDACSETSQAYDAIRRAFLLRPDHPETLELMLNLAEGDRELEDLRTLSQRLGLESLVSHLEARLGSHRSLHVQEETALEEAIRLRLRQLSRRVINTLKAISNFPQPFTQEQAEQICSVSREDLVRVCAAFPVTREGVRYRLSPPVRKSIQRLTGPHQNGEKEFHTNLLAYLEEQLQNHDRERFSSEDQELLVLGILIMTKEVPSLPRVRLVIQYTNVLKDRAAIERVYEPLVQYLHEARQRLPEPERYFVYYNLGGLAYLKQNFVEAVSWLSCLLEKHPLSGEDPWDVFLIAIHHAAHDSLFDQVVQHLQTLPPEHERWVQIHGSIAENYMARGRFEEALEYCDQALQRQLNTAQSADGPMLQNLRATILKELGRLDEAAAHWDKTLRQFLAVGNLEGIAQCYQNLGSLTALQGQHALGEQLVQQAQEQFKQLGNVGAVAACHGTLGDIALLREDREGARANYEQGLAFWRTQKHPRWITRFERRLEEIERSQGKIGG